MSSKKGQNEDSKKCPYFDRGFCKYKYACRNKHSDTVCNDTNCNEEQCDKRHPILANIVICVDFSKRIFVYSSHVSVACDDVKVTVQKKTLNEKFDTFEKKMKEMQTVIDKKKLRD